MTTPSQSRPTSMVRSTRTRRTGEARLPDLDQRRLGHIFCSPENDRHTSADRFA